MTARQGNLFEYAAAKRRATYIGSGSALPSSRLPKTGLELLGQARSRCSACRQIFSALETVWISDTEGIFCASCLTQRATLT